MVYVKIVARTYEPSGYDRSYTSYIGHAKTKDGEIIFKTEDWSSDNDIIHDLYFDAYKYYKQEEQKILNKDKEIER